MRRLALDEAALATAPSSAAPRARRRAARRRAARDAGVRAAGLLIVTPDGRALFLQRSDRGDHAGEWGIPGGKIEGGEEPLDAALRETEEEAGWAYSSSELDLLDERTSDEGVEFTTFRVQVPGPFMPELDEEHVGWAWAPLSAPPQPLHPGVAATIEEQLAGDAAESGATRGLLRRTIEYPPARGPGDERAVDLSMRRGGAGRTLREAPQARHFGLTSHDDAEDLAPGQLSSAEMSKFRGMAPRQQSEVISLLEKIKRLRDKDPVRAAQYQKQLDRIAGDVYRQVFGDAEFKEEEHPRDESGRFGRGGGGATKSEKTEAKGEGEHPGKGYSKEARVVDGKIHTSSILDATRALYEKRDVELAQPREVSTLIDHLGKVAARWEKLGEKAPVFDLCKVAVRGTNLFCAEATDIPRVKMPQLRKGDEEKFNAHLREAGYAVDDTTELASHLRATQSEIGGARVAKIIRQLRRDKKNLERRVMVSRDNYILDGHHFWAARLGYAAADNKLSENTRMNVSRVDISIVDLLREAEKFTGGAGKVAVHDRALGSDKGEWQESKHPRGQPGNAGQFGSGGGGGAKRKQAEQSQKDKQFEPVADPSALSESEVRERVAHAGRRAMELAAKPTNEIDTPERRALRSRLIDEIYERDIGSRRHERDATIILGLPAAGKSTVANPIIKEKGALEIDPDIAKTMLPEFENGVGASAVHEESSDITKNVLKRALAAGDNIVWPRVDSPQKIVDDITTLKKLGYKVHLRHLEVAPEVAEKSAIDRFLKTGRYVPPSLIQEFGSSPRDAYLKAKEHADSSEAYTRGHGTGIEKIDL